MIDPDPSAYAWRVAAPSDLPTAYLPEQPDLVRQIVWARGYRSPTAATLFVHPHRFRLPDLEDYPALRAAADRICAGLARGERICVWGDFDVDGQAGTAILVGVLRRLGAQVVYFMPDRLLDGHGLHSAGLAWVAAQGCTLLITCDCGANDAAAVEEAGALGIAVVITDHHEAIGVAPRAVAVCNSAVLPAGDPLRDLPGAAMAYVLARLLCARRGRPEEAHQELDLVALGIVADVAPNVPAARALLVRGLDRLWHAPRPGLQALMQVTRGPAHPYDTDYLAFQLGPALNAPGRLGDARLSVELLLAADAPVAHDLATRLAALNATRRRLQKELEAAIEALQDERDSARAALIFSGEAWHVGLIGVVASQYAERYRRPVVVIALDPDGQMARGSARGAPGLPVLAAIESQGHLLSAYGGHPGAAGFRLRRQDVAAFTEGFLRALAGQAGAPAEGAVPVDALVPWEAVAGPNAAQALFTLLAPLAPYYSGNPAPVLASTGLRLLSLTPFGAEGQHARLLFGDSDGRVGEVTWWRYKQDLQPGRRYDVAYKLAPDEWRGQQRVRLIVEAIRLSCTAE
jgi:single-stranded-DNA-specific exonuclease